MATKKEKLIEEAQKLAIKGPIDRAVKAYEQVVALEPNAINHRQRLADLLVKSGRKDDARKEYEVIGKNLSTNGFYLRAIAIYTQLQKLFPSDITINLSLAGLNEKHGLVANALAEYKKVYDYHVKNEEADEALTVLQKMQNVDPQNVNIRLKLAEAYFAAGKKDESYTVFSKLATLLQERGDAAASTKLTARIQQLFPDKSSFMLEVLAEQVTSGHASSAVNGLQALLRTNPKDKRVWDLVIEAYTQLHDPQRLKSAYQHYLKFIPDELSPKAGLILCVVAEKDLKGALELLGLYEQQLIAGGRLNELERAYRTLEELDPINLRVLEGLRAVYAAAGKKEELVTIEAKIQSLQGLSGGKVKIPAKAIPLPQPEPLPEPVPETFVEPDYFSGQAMDEPEFGEITFNDSHADEPPLSAQQEDVGFSVAFGEDQEEEIEVEVEIDIDEELEAEASAEVAIEEDWLEVAAKLLESIATKGGKVKFGNSLDGDDAQSHYDLGLAFMEMGLFDESLKEFRQASADSERRFTCYVFQGVCLRQKGDLKNAEKVLRALAFPGLLVDDICTVKYELALTCEASGKNDEYIALLTEIEKLDRKFRDVHHRLAVVHGDDDSLDFSDDDLKGLDF